MSDHVSSDANSCLWELQVMNLGGFAVFDKLPFLFDGNLINEGERLIKLNISDNWDLCVSQLWNVNFSLHGG